MPLGDDETLLQFVNEGGLAYLKQLICCIKDSKLLVQYLELLKPFFKFGNAIRFHCLTN
jgi:hypothetical protein